MNGSFSFDIPATYFSPFEVKDGFSAKVWYGIRDNKAEIDGVLIGIECLRYLSSWGKIKLANDIEEKVANMCSPLIKEEKEHTYEAINS